MKVALVGLGRWGRRYPEILIRLGAELVVCHTRQIRDNVDWLAASHPGVRHSTSLAAVLDHELDGVVIATPRQTHGALVIECLRRDLHVLVEKPAATSVADARVAEAEASARGLVLRTGYTHCHDTTLRALADLVAGCTAPSWRLVWHKFAPGTGPSDIVWEYVPHVISIAHLLGGGVGPVVSNIRREPSETGTVEIAMGMGTAEVSTRPGIPRIKRITLFDSDDVVAEWTDRHLFDKRNNVTVEATEEPLANQVRSFFDEILAPNPLRSAATPPEVATTELLVALASTIEPSAALN